VITDHRSEAYRNEVLQCRVTETRAVLLPCYEVANEVLRAA
jgi:hypothetical protein